MQSVRSSGMWRYVMMAIRPAAALVPASVYSHLWFRGPFQANVYGIKFAMQHTGNELENQVFWRDTFLHEAGAVNAVLPYLREMDVMFDVGANTGFFSLLAKAAHSSAKVIAIEPSVANFAILQRNIQLNEFDIEAVAAAVTSESKMVTLFDFPEVVSYSASLEASWRQGTVAREVQGVTLDELASAHGVFGKRVLVKLDVEGHEVQVLQGARELIESSPVFLIEIIRDYVAEGVRELLPPGSFSYLFIDEKAMTTHNVTEKFARGVDVEMGNYLVLPRGYSAS
jgi:FkbM family methyltransferase